MDFETYLWICGISVTAMAGYWIWRLRQWNSYRDNTGRKRTAEYMPGRSIASPVEGAVFSLDEEGGLGAVIDPVQGRIYAPVSGRIIRVYPTGNAFLLRTKDRMDILIGVGRSHDEMHSRYYLSRVLQGEIVEKGQLLLVFDREGLQAEGADTEVYVRVESEDAGDAMDLTNRSRVCVGEELLQIRHQPVNA